MSLLILGLNVCLLLFGCVIANSNGFANNFGNVDHGLETVKFRARDNPENVDEVINSGKITELTDSPIYEPLLDTLNATQRAIKYFLDNFDTINIDAVTAIRMVQEQLQIILSRFDGFAGIHSLSQDAKLALKKDLTNFNISTSDICNHAIPSLKISDKAYFDTMEPLIRGGAWSFDYPSRVTNQSLIYSRDNLTEEFDESKSDNCYSELIGTNEHAGLPCSPTNDCWKYQTGPNAKGYKLTHQILYMQIAEKATRCSESVQRQIELNNQVSPAHLVDTFCANVLQDIKYEANHSFGVGVRDHDMFMEQAGLCGMMGFRDMFSLPWLKNILKWQKPEGCFGPMQSELHDYIEYQVEKAVKSIMQNIHLTKREEKFMPNWCLSHQTGVGLNVLAQYLRYLLEDPTLVFQQ